MSKKKPLILVTNDDGITAPGIRALIDVMEELGEVVVVAPDSPQSGMGHAITISDTLFCDPMKVDEKNPAQGVQLFGHPCRLCEDRYPGDPASQTRPLCKRY